MRLYKKLTREVQKYYENTAISNICGTIFYKSAKNIELLKKSLNIVIGRQAGLRLRFVENGGTPKQYVEKYSPTEIPVRRFENIKQLEQYVMEDAKTPVRLLNSVMSVLKSSALAQRQEY